MNEQERFAMGRTDHIQDSAKRKRVKDFLANTIASLEAIGTDDDPEYVKENIYRDDGLDGVAPTSIDEIEHIQRDRIDKLRSALIIDPDTEPEDSTACTEPVPVGVSDDLNRKGRFGYTPLHEAVVAGDAETVRSLLGRGANKTIRDNGGNTPYDKALKFEFYEIAKLLA